MSEGERKTHAVALEKLKLVFQLVKDNWRLLKVFFTDLCILFQQHDEQFNSEIKLPTSVRFFILCIYLIKSLTLDLSTRYWAPDEWRTWKAISTVIIYM